MSVSSLLSTQMLSNSLSAFDRVHLPGSGEAEGLGLGSGHSGTEVSFLEVQTASKRVVLMYDISSTVANAALRTGMPMEHIRTETVRLIESLGVNTRFGLVQFARNYAFFKNELLPATQIYRQEAKNWLNRHFATTGSFPPSVPGMVRGSPGFLVVLEEVFRLRPETVFIISDGSFQRGMSGNATIPMGEIQSRLGTLQASLPQPANIFFIGVGVSMETENALRRLLANHGGRGGYSRLGQ